jgi:hypothetical protein
LVHEKYWFVFQHWMEVKQLICQQIHPLFFSFRDFVLILNDELKLYENSNVTNEYQMEETNKKKKKNAMIQNSICN